MTDLHDQRILVLDFGGQTTQLIARRVRESGVYCEIHPWDISDQVVREFQPRGVILSGGPESVIQEGSPTIPSAVLGLDVPILGICYGMQAMVHQLGGEVQAQAAHSEFGHARVTLQDRARLFDGLQDHSSDGKAQLDVWMSHGDRVEQLPEGFTLIGTSANAPGAIIANEAAGRYGIQFHPEVTHTTQGAEILRRFVLDICQCDGLWTPDNIIDDAVARVQETVGADEVILALSGGVDSSVVAALLHKAIGKQLTCVFVDNGLLRLHEGDQVMQTFADNMGVHVIRVNAQDRFMEALAGVTDPEAKRKIIGNLFVEIFEEEAAKLKNAKWLAQGTIYPDVIESAASTSGSAHLIKSHHNVGGLPSEMRLKLVEPLRELFKDEVRTIGVDLGLPPIMVQRHPFPGPGLGVRILGEVKKEYADILREADAIFINALLRHDLYNKVSQAFTVFLPIKSVGVTGDGRRYDYVVALRAVETIDFMTARAAQLPWDFLDEVSRTICNSIPRISRVTYDISSKPPATIEWE
ncbi:glutamine-hydrolyzing GMP synthase [Granulosicoccus sp. 3-233]|uniref:glutamine-hydrolyzing GMP synthase n=1 Tax=Granulosicoccus sp. 3-233 TaxID=3417969 RepID=UPI003D326216